MYEDAHIYEVYKIKLLIKLIICVRYMLARFCFTPY